MSKIKFPLSVLQPLKKHLTAEEQKLKKRQLELDAEDPYKNTDRVNDNADVADDAAEESGHDRVAALKLEIDKALIEIRKTLTKIRLGKYGLCENCGQMIDTDRLAIKPTATLCINCANNKK